jgi:hypothetical protein
MTEYFSNDLWGQKMNASEKKASSFKAGTQLTKAIADITRGENVRCAVAFWGLNAPSRMGIPKNAKVRAICNLRMGGTNAFEIEKLWKDKKHWDWRHSDTLHAKVYLSDKGVVVGSANASTNGLALEGQEQDSWMEAGIFLNDAELSSAVADWFEDLWKSSKKITGKDIAIAKEAREKQRNGRPTLLSFVDYHLDKEFPLITWYSESGDIEVNKKQVKRQLGDYSLEIRDLIDEGIDIEAAEDEALLTQNRWVLMYHRKNAKELRGKDPFGWVQIHKPVRQAFKYEDDENWRDVMIPNDRPSPPPFAVNTPDFRDAFYKVLERRDFSKLRDWETDGAWYLPRKERTQAFWVALQKEMRKIKSLNP